MEVTEVRIKLVDNPTSRLRAYASIIIDNALCIRDLKVIESDKGWFVAMPCRKLDKRCYECKGKNPVSAKFCLFCGHGFGQLPFMDRSTMFADTVHPINNDCRDMINDEVLDAYDDELALSKKQGYASSYGRNWEEL